MSYIFEDHLLIYPYIFIVMYLLYCISFNYNKLNTKINESITLIQTIALVYWLIEMNFLHYKNWFMLSLYTVVAFLSIFSLLHAFTSIRLSRLNRITLSIWSSIIMLVFGVYNVINTYQNQFLENSSKLNDIIYIGVQFFLLGISSIYIYQNVL